jgi:hypothetical protein
VKRYSEGADPDEVKLEIMDSNAIADLIINRSLYFAGAESTEAADTSA